MNIEKTNFEKLDVYKLSEQLSDTIWDIVIEWDYFAKDTVGKQLVKSADSIGANIAEGSGRIYKKETNNIINKLQSTKYKAPNL